jgi:hypothetical protein
MSTSALVGLIERATDAAEIMIEERNASRRSACRECALALATFGHHTQQRVAAELAAAPR